MQKFFPISQAAKQQVIFTNARIVDPESGFDMPGEILVENGIIADFGKNIFSGSYPNGFEIIDCGGNVLCPGLLDIQVHFRTPGQNHKEDIVTGTKSA